jgi:molybdopterin synthase catalytic subunit/molybdopterin converting factor small subunit
MSVETTVLFFASLREKVGRPKIQMYLPEGTDVSRFKGMIKEKFPDLSPYMSSALISINCEFAFDGDIIPDGAEVALFPPVSGGGGESRNVIKITGDALDLDGILAEITSPTTGAACIFSGMVRAETTREQPHQTLYLEYEAYQHMAIKMMEQVAMEIRERWSQVDGIAIVQRIGRLYPETPTVMIACTAGHRDEGVFEAARYGIDRLKEIVPIWKKEVGPDKQVWVEGKYTPQPKERQNAR